jgi:hypothetical protein
MQAKEVVATTRENETMVKAKKDSTKIYIVHK